MITTKNLKYIGLLLLMILAGNAMAQQPAIQYFRYNDQRGVNVFETSKSDTVPYDGFKFRIGAGFTQGYQNLSHSNAARVVLPDGTNGTYIQLENGNFINRTDMSVTPVEIPGNRFVADPNVWGAYVYTPDPVGAPNTQRILTNASQLYEQSGGFPLAQANLIFDVQLTDGVRLHLASYMSSHHHNEFWVKGGYIQVDKVGFLNSAFMDKLWENLTLKVGHMEINYGDQHFRRSDGGNTIYNPFIENYIMDEFTTEIGAELYFQKKGFLAMAAYTDGEIQGNVTKPNDRKPSFYGKVGVDRKVNEDLRVRLTGSAYFTNSSVSNTLFGGDRTGSNYQYVLQPYNATLTGNAFAGRFNPGYSDNLTTFMINPFIKFKGLEFFGTYENAKGNSAVENGEIQYSDPNLNNGTDLPVFKKLDNRTTSQFAADVVYRFGKNEKFYVGARYNKVNSQIVLGTAANSAAYISQGERFDVSIDRTAIAAGWFITKNLMLKGEYVKQTYTDFPGLFVNTSTSATGYYDTSLLTKGKFDGFVIQGLISF